MPAINPASDRHILPTEFYAAHSLSTTGELTATIQTSRHGNLSVKAETEPQHVIASLSTGGETTSSEHVEPFLNGATNEGHGIQENTLEGCLIPLRVVRRRSKEAQAQD